MDTFRRCLSSGKTRGRFIDFIPWYGSLYSINHKIELFLGYCEFNSEQHRANMPVSFIISVSICLNRSNRKAKTICTSPTYTLYTLCDSIRRQSLGIR